jgi:2-polyprenyl-3-methyl-5-hydroxy-6-metoxy-1,4-benzoquinol methylase
MQNEETLKGIQRRISAAFSARDGDNDPYSNVYMKQEYSYWSPVISWMDSLSHIDSVLDVGGAYGTLLMYAIAKFNPSIRTLVDPISNMPESLVLDLNIERIQGDFEREELLENRKYDLIIFTEVLEHLNFHPLPTLRRLASKLNEGGVLVMSTPDGSDDAWGRVTTYFHSLAEIPEYDGQTTKWVDDHIWQFTPDEVKGLLENLDIQISAFATSPGVWARHQCWLLTRE